MKKQGTYDVFNSAGEFKGRVKLIEDCCEKLLNIKINSLYGLKQDEYFLKLSKE